MHSKNIKFGRKIIIDSVVRLGLTNSDSNNDDGDDDSEEFTNGYSGPKLTPEEEEALLDSFREERILQNDRWQSFLFRDNQCGLWEGIINPFHKLE